MVGKEVLEDGFWSSDASIHGLILGGEIWWLEKGTGGSRTYAVKTSCLSLALPAYRQNPMKYIDR